MASFIEILGEFKPHSILSSCFFFSGAMKKSNETFSEIQ